MLEERLHQLYGPPSTVHQGGDIDWDYEQYQEALAQLEAEGVIRPADGAAERRHTVAAG